MQATKSTSGFRRVLEILGCNNHTERACRLEFGRPCFALTPARREIGGLRVHRLAANRMIRESALLHHCRIVQIAAIEDHRRSHPFLHFIEVGGSELRPFRKDRQRVGIVQSVHWLLVHDDFVAVQRGDVLHGFGIVCHHPCSGLQQIVDQHQRRRFADIVSPRFEGQSPQRNRLSIEVVKMGVDLVFQDALLLLVDPVNGFQQSWFDASFFKGGDHCAYIFRKTAAAIAHTGEEERKADAAVVPNSAADVIDVRFKMFANVGHLVDKADLRGQQCVGDVFGQLGAFRRHFQERFVRP